MVVIPTVGYLNSYAVDDSHWQQYLAALYWAMTTITTVGYGDILPVSDAERGLAMVSMVVGGTFYGYIIGSMVSLIHQLNLHQEACVKRMENIRAWLDFHNFPMTVRLGVWRHFKRHFNQNTAVEDAAGIVECLPPDLQDTVTELMVDDVVLCNPLFDDIPSVFTHIAPILQQTTVGKGTRVTLSGEPGRNMFIIQHGKVRLERGGHTKGQPCALRQSHSQLLSCIMLQDGDSFGEEIILGVEDCYGYTVTTISKVTMFTISEKQFAQQFESMPEVYTQMRENFTSNYLNWSNLMAADRA